MKTEKDESYGEILNRLFGIPITGGYVTERTFKINDFFEANKDDIIASLVGWLEKFGQKLPPEVLGDFNVNPLHMFQTGMLFGYFLKEKELRESLSQVIRLLEGASATTNRKKAR